MVPINEQRKAILAGVIALLSTLVTGLTDMPLTWAEGAAALLAGVLAYGGVYSVGNYPPSR